ncbi:ISWI chromatin-remodeling complex ATPase ISW2 [Dothidotthia symphoricarpi CBS 119687]|uniref:ISWI chromatin-remodeling complex ATPase ISW2 n=1 Tax=Dothidotthia symphoricarpi CBS 119687 TaxID=1392245 RepID=A0A6A6AGV8_9PLEO|nr:ISWI chromatin-remodeling complex ATPase ISW2 [Dothidotthia symphoricarpi CBS 119687]KAF2129671.1 ISWI chromatin-remodeling complex ATPase ISW2 [Dothidotthia symphoricarpi CBS 119687]
MPTTPKDRRGGHLQGLLAQFGSQSSAESATKMRRMSSQHEPAAQPESKRALRQQTAPNYAASEPSTASSPDASVATPDPKPSKRTRRATVKDTPSSPTSEQDPEEASDSSEDELARSVRPVRTRGWKASARSSARYSDLKMEARKKDKADDGLRRSTRSRKSNILESDTLDITPPPSSKRKALPRKLDTARARLRDDIAHKTKAKADNFLVANKDFFLPLLPPTNYVSRLVTRHDAKPIVEYTELTDQPEGVTATMKPYQLSGLSYLVHLYNNGFSGILGDEMGLGKTLQTLSLFQHLEELDEKNGVTSEELRPYLVVCPLSVLNSWVTEAQKWVPGLRVLRFHGAVNERARLKRVAVGLEDLKGNETSQAKDRKASRKAGIKVGKISKDQGSSSFKIIVTTYDTFQAEQAWFKMTFLWRYVVLDEGHKIKSSVTQISTALRNISSEYRLILTGTPLQNNLAEMWALLAWLYPNVFVDTTEVLFKESFDLNRGKVNRQTMDDARRLLELIMLRRMKDSPSVQLGLPPKEEILLYVPLTPMQRFWYTRLLTRVDDRMLNELFADGKQKEKAAITEDAKEKEILDRMEKLGHSAGTSEWEETAEIMRQAIAKEQVGSEVKSAWQKLMNLVMQLRKCCSHPYLLPDVAPDPYYLGGHVIRASGKFILLDKLLRHSIFEQGKKVLIFSGFTRTLDCCEDLLSLISNQGERFRHLRLDGGSARARRNLDIRLFNQQGSEYKVMLLSTRAGGLGINLTSAEDVIFLDEDWNPQITLQAEARAHRIGQTKPVTIYKLCTQGTVEEQMMGRIRKKLYLSAKITESMQNIHGKQTVTKSKGRQSIAEDMPQMDTSQLKTLVRRGAQTLSHPEIDATEMIQWDLETMMAKCRDKPADLANPEASHSEMDEEKWLSVMERVECAVFDGKRYQRKLDTKASQAAANILPDTITREDRRRGKNTTVMLNGYAINKESMNCGAWEAVPTLAGKDPRLADPVREGRRQFAHESHCLSCFEGDDNAHMITCKSCPRAYHFDCLDAPYQAKVRGFTGFFCPQHNCTDCAKNTTDAGGLIFRCRWCPRGFCEDCLDWDATVLVGENLPELELLGEGPSPGGFYVKCPDCIDQCKDSAEHNDWLTGMEEAYKDQHDIWVRERAQAQREMEERDALAANMPKNNDKPLQQEVIASNSALPLLVKSSLQRPSFGVVEDHSTDTDDEVPSLTDTSLPTPALAVSPMPADLPPKAKKHKRVASEAEGRVEKKVRLDAGVWSPAGDLLVGGEGE